MADNVIILDADGNRITVGADEVTSRNGSTVPAEKIQREKVGFGGDGTYQDVSAATPMPVTDAAQATVHTDLAALLTELGQKLEPADLNLLATAAKQDVAHTDLAAILAKLSADPATQTTLAAILAKLTADPSTATNQASGNTKLDTLITDDGGPGSSQPSLVNGGSGKLGYLRNILDALRGALDVSDRAARQLGRLTDGTFGYAAGTATGNIDVPTGARIKRVSVVASASANATITILGGNTITVLAGGAFDEQLPGDAVATSSTSEVVIGGSIQTYYVAWVA